MTALRRFFLVLVAVLAASVLAACATIPRSGPVTRGGSLSDQDDRFGQISFHPDAPSPGQSQDEVLRGFIAAALSPDNSYQIAREYLSDSFRSHWNPDASVTVDQEALRSDPQRINSTELRIKVAPVAFIDEAGDYRTSSSQSPVPLSYAFVKQGGQWRISQAPDGIVIDTSQLQNVFSPQALYFYSPDYAYLVPDLRWFPSSRAALATRIVKALLAGPSTWLDGAVATAFPKGAQLSSGSVVVQGGQAEVALNSTAGGSDTTSLNRMDEQLTATLTANSAISSVDLSIGGVTQNISGTTDAISDPSVDTNPLVLKDGKFGFLSGKSLTPLGGVDEKVAALHPTAATVTDDASAAAALAGGAVYAVADSSSAVRIDERAHLLAPSIDNHGIVWSATSSAADPIAVAAADGATTTLRADWPDARTLLSFAVSRDGTRLAALVGTADGQAHLMAAGIVRDANGHPTRISTPTDFGGLGLTQGISLAWSDELTVAVLGVSPQGGTAIVTQRLGDVRADATAGPAGGITVAGGNSASQLWVLTSDGALETPAGNGWQTAATEVSVLAIQQGHR
jgi:hypothetical protein